MVGTYNGWDDSPEDERETLDLWESAAELGRPLGRRSRTSQAVIRVRSDRYQETLG